MGKPLDSPASSLSLSPSASQSFLNTSSYPVYSFFLESNSIFSPCQASFLPGQSTLDQILFLFQSILDEFNKPRLGSQTILATIDFSKAFDSVWHPALFRKLILACISPCFAHWTQSFLSDRCACLVYQKSQKPLLLSPSRCSARTRSWPCTVLSFHQ